MNPRKFEELICEYFSSQGYKAETTSYHNDYGVDVFAINDKEKLAIQAKMFGGTTRKINRQMVMELHGAKDYFDCTRAIIATDGTLLPDAIEVAMKLKIEILFIDSFTPIVAKRIKKNSNKNKNHYRTFESIWEEYIIPLTGKILTRVDSKSNKILKVDWSGIERVTSNGKKGKIKIEIFKYAVSRLLTDSYITRDTINQNYPGRASSGVVLILSQVPFFKLTTKPIGLQYEK